MGSSWFFKKAMIDIFFYIWKLSVLGILVKSKDFVLILVGDPWLAASNWITGLCDRNVFNTNYPTKLFSLFHFYQT